MPYGYQLKSEDQESVRKIHICSHCSEEMQSKEKFCGRCDTEEKRSKLAAVNAAIREELKKRYA